MSQGDLCKLTGHYGKFVDSHLLPKAFTRPSARGARFVQAGMGTRPVPRWDSWYDPKLVTCEGERILRDLDDWAIVELRKHELVWTGWKGAGSPVSKPKLIAGEMVGIREIRGINPGRLRLFFLSLLWRAAATTLPEFAAVGLPPDDLEQLRLMLLSKEPGEPDFYPTQLIQLYTLGEIHNHTPIAQTKTILADDNEPERQIPIFRFYFDGLIAHFHRHACDDGYTLGQGSITVGHGEELLVTAVPYESSFQRNILEEIQRQAAATWPDVLARLSS
jgi:hypothetical protein